MPWLRLVNKNGFQPRRKTVTSAEDYNKEEFV
jgi:hypothetical protein